MPTIGLLTGQLRLYSSGQRESADALFDQLLPRLREIAARVLSDSRFTQSAEPLELVNETWLTRLQRGGWRVDSREHFFALAGLAMEQVLIDMARRRLAKRHGGDTYHVSIEDVSGEGHPVSADAEKMLAIASLLAQLDQQDLKTAEVVRGRYFMGLGFQEIAEGTG